MTSIRNAHKLAISVHSFVNHWFPELAHGVSLLSLPENRIWNSEMNYKQHVQVNLAFTNVIHLLPMQRTAPGLFLGLHGIGHLKTRGGQQTGEQQTVGEGQHSGGGQQGIFYY